MSPSKLSAGISSVARPIIILLLLSCFETAAAQLPTPIYFEQVLEKRLASESPGGNATSEKFCPVSNDLVAARILESYGAVFVASDLVRLPPRCIHRSEAEVARFQAKFAKKALEMNGVRIELQTAAATALESAVRDIGAEDLTITPLDGSIAAGRSYGDTLMLWNSRVFPAMEFWIRRGRLSPSAPDEIGRLDLQKKVEKVIEWESQGIYFSSDRTRSILTSTAPPGTSQHLYLVAFDVSEFWNPEIRSILNRNGWFQTVIDDPAHFTYLGFSEAELPARGLTAVAKGGHQYWVPHLRPRANSTN
ncbi:MAG: hypothetical protein ABIO91_01015 [Pyrinomonadaceae bacterium]